MTSKTWPLLLLLNCLIGLSVSQVPTCDSIGHTATVRVAFGSSYPTEIPGQLGNPLFLRCDVTFGSSNAPTIGSFTWEHNGQIISSDSRSQLNIDRLRSNQGGIYRCRATAANSQCQTQYSEDVTVNTPPTITSISPSMINILEGQSFQISCQADGYPMPTFEWYKTTATSVILSTQAMYSVQAATVATSGIYVCRASNGQARPVSQLTARVTVSPPPPTTIVPPTTESATTVMTNTEEVTPGNLTTDTRPTGSTGFYISVGIIGAVSVIFTLLTFLCFTAWLVYSYKKNEQANHEGEEMQMEYQEMKLPPSYDHEEAVLVETAVPMETVDTNEIEVVIPQPRKKKTRGKRRKF